jgi:hypothetical protein
MGDDKMTGMKQNSVEDKLSKLKNFWRTRGLCIRCDDKWAPSHRCAPQPQLHALQEVWELLQDSFEEPSKTQLLDDHLTRLEAPTQLFLALSGIVYSRYIAPHAMQFKGFYC